MTIHNPIEFLKAKRAARRYKHDWRGDGSCRKCDATTISELASRKGCPRTHEPFEDVCDNESEDSDD